MKIFKRIVIGVPLLCFFVWLGYMLVGGNFFTVEDGMIYRSAQPSRAMIEKYHDEYGIKSIINLRGKHTEEDWYNEEVNESAKLGIVHFDLPFSATHEATQTQMEILLKTIREAPKPLWIHCAGGSDRTGLAVSLYMYGIKQQDAKHAKKGLSLFYGHFPYLWSKTGAMDRSFDNFIYLHEQSKVTRIERDKNISKFQIKR